MAALAGTAAAGQDAPVERLRAAAAAAWKGPDFRAAAAGLESERAAARLEAHPGAPYTELQREGIASGFDAADNAGWYLRLGAPVKAPWQFGAIRNALDATRRELEARRRLIAFETAGSSAGAWLRLAAVEARLEILHSQAEQLGEVLKLQRKRLELGEISGAEVKQLELEQLRLMSAVSGLRAEQASAARELGRWAGSDAPRPLPGDLHDLQSSLAPLGEELRFDDPELLKSSPLMTVAALRSERIHSEGRRDRRTVAGPAEAEISWERIPEINGVEGFDAVGLRLRLPLPIGGAVKRQAEEARARQQEAGAELERTESELIAAAGSAAERARAAGATLAALTSAERDLARVEQSLFERYRLGSIAYLEYIDGLQRLDDIRTLAVNARLDHLLARLDLAMLTGDLTLFPLPDPGPEMLP